MVFDGRISALSSGTEMKVSDANHPKALYVVYYYPPYVAPKLMGSIGYRITYWRLRDTPFNFPYKCIVFHGGKIIYM